jgi:hypothetical protein
MTSEELAWAAGLFEGEGCVAAYHHSKNARAVRAWLSSTDEDVIHRFHEIVGVGRLSGPYHQNGFDRQGLRWRWQVSRKPDVTEFLDGVYPYLGHRRREQIVVAFEKAGLCMASGHGAYSFPAAS